MLPTHYKWLLFFIFIFLLATPLFSENEAPMNPHNSGQVIEEHNNITHQMTQLVIQISLILLFTWVGGTLAKKIHLPSVIGQIFAGILIGPFVLGGIPLPGFPQGLFPIFESSISISPLIYSLGTIASIILLFIAGLETDLGLFIRYAAKGSVVGIGGVLVSFFSGTAISYLFTGLPFFHPLNLFLGTLSVATSVGITATILSEQRKIDSPEGVVILSAAVIDDVLGIIILAIVLGIASVSTTTGTVDWGSIGLIALKAIGVWLAFTLLGLFLSRRIGKTLKNVFKDRSMLTVMALGMALLLAGIFEQFGLSMIIGAYIMGLSLSNTDLAFMIQSKLRTLHDFFVPIFFAVSGMMVNIPAIANWDVISFGLVFTVVAIAAKLLGSGGPSLFLNFNMTGAIRIGLGMVPRGEVALIMAGIGISNGIIGQKEFGVALLMTILSTIIAPPVLNLYLKMKKSGQRIEVKKSEKKETVVQLQSPEFADLIMSKFMNEMEKEGFFINAMEHDESLYHIRKDDIFITLTMDDDGNASFISDEADIPLFQTALYESLLSVSNSASEMKDAFKPKELVKSISTTTEQKEFDLRPFTDESLVIRRLQSDTKEEIIKELMKPLEKSGYLADKELVFRDVMEREKSMSTGLQNGIAIPHAKTNGTNTMRFVIGLKPEGMDFAALDEKPSKFFILIVSPKQGYGPHIQLLAALSGKLNKVEKQEALVKARTNKEVHKVLFD